MGLLHIDSSANRTGESVSRQLTGVFAETWQERNASAGYRHRDLAADPVAPLSTAYCALGRRLEQRGLVPLAEVAARTESREERQEWALTRPLIDEVLAADTVLIGAPMYNYAVPASLKAWIDRITFPGAFTDLRTGDRLLRRTKFVVISARGGAYGPGSPRHGWDFQTPYLRAYLTNHGVDAQNMHFVDAEQTVAELMPHLAQFRPQARASLEAARAEVAALAMGDLPSPAAAW